MNHRQKAVDELTILIRKVVKSALTGSVLIDKKPVDVELHKKAIPTPVIEQKSAEIVDHIIEECMTRMNKELDNRMKSHLQFRHKEQIYGPGSLNK